ncbi:uncharacterized protein COX6CL [Eurosta solidaginis]|uniref:uncharacterized protein COX6CL n=1 Tax=Eurosta solidaginis TaxID=178769 RepID=UPI0035308CBE
MSTTMKSKTPPKPPPQLFYNHRQMALRNVAFALGASLFAGLAFHFLHNKPHKAKYREFYSNYDPEKAFKSMAEGGYLQSCPPCIFNEDENGENGDKNKKK